MGFMSQPLIAIACCTCLVSAGCGVSRDPQRSSSADSTQSRATVRVESQPTLLPRRDAKQSTELLSECYRGVTPNGPASSLERTDFFCSKIYRRSSCAEAWYAMSIEYTTPRNPSVRFDGLPLLTTVVNNCRAEYCLVSKATQPALCVTSEKLTKASFAAFTTWLIEQELTFPKAEIANWANSLYFGAWLE